MQTYLGIDVGAETLRIVELSREGKRPRWTARRELDHGKDPSRRLNELLGCRWKERPHIAVTGRLSRELGLPRVPARHARAAAHRFLVGEEPATLVSIGSHGFSVLELRPGGMEAYRENSRCSQGTGNFLRQLCERFGLTPEEADALCADVEQAAPLSGRCPVILKTDMTHLANKGEDRSRILAGLFDAVCENVQVLLKPGLSPPEVYLLGGVGRSKRIRRTFERSLSRLGMKLVTTGDPDDALYYDALGTALSAAEGLATTSDIRGLGEESSLERLPPLSSH
ncbi:MAG: BadF/BadG/BcrA/BcrD ATPase family protein, partial [Myxococcota bacterium]